MNVDTPTHASLQDGMLRHWLAVGAMMAMLGVVVGAYTAHGLERYLLARYGQSASNPSDSGIEKTSDAGLEKTASAGSVANPKPGSEATPSQISKRLAQAETGVRYHLIHAVAIVAAAAASPFLPRRSTSIACGLLLAGTLCFSGSLYVIVLFDLPKLGALVTPAGGLLLMLGWLTLTKAALHRNHDTTRPAI
jgi:uncharacterized membrane protein YgdD (TMEM256/DUF423 family)